MSTIVLRSVKGSALTFTEMDDNFNNLNTDKLQNVVEDTTPQLGGNLDVNGQSIVSASDGNISITPNGTGKIVLDGLSWPTADGTANQVIKTDGSGNLSFVTPSGGLSNVVEDTTPQLGGDLDIQNYKITTSTTNGDILLEPNGIGVVFNKAVVFVDDVTTSGFGAISGNTSVGLALLTNAGANSATDPQLALISGGGISITAGSSSTTTFNGSNVSNLQLKDYKETIYSLGTTSGTISPDVANGNVQTITLNGNMTFGGFSNPEEGQSLTLIIHQDGTGSRTFSEGLASDGLMLFAGGDKTLTTAANSTDIMSIVYTGGIYYASLAKNFS